MHVGVQMVFQSVGYGPEVTDRQIVEWEIELAVLAEKLGFDTLWPVEHHFEDYAFCPDNVVLLAHLAARTTSIRLGTGAVIVPWNDPLRVAEKIALLDNLAPGRLVLGLGRGLARREYEGFGIDMSESRDRFDEGAALIIRALETGYAEGSGPYYPQKRVPLRPAPLAGFADRLYCVAMSPDSAMSAAELGGRMVIFSQRPWEQQAASVNDYRERFRAVHGVEPPPLTICDFVICDEDPARAEALAYEHIAGYLRSVVEHYELAGEHLKHAAGYASYGNAVDALRAAGMEKACELYLAVQAWGTPDQILEKLRARRDVVGDFDLTCCFRFSGLPYDAAEQNMRTFAEHVMPTLRTWQHASVAAKL